MLDTTTVPPHGRSRLPLNVASLIAMLLLGGCERPDTDVSSLPRYNFTPFVGTVWKTKVKMAVVDQVLYTAGGLTLVYRPRANKPWHYLAALGKVVRGAWGCPASPCPKRQGDGTWDKVMARVDGATRGF